MLTQKSFFSDPEAGALRPAMAQTDRVLAPGGTTTVVPVTLYPGLGRPFPHLIARSAVDLSETEEKGGQIVWPHKSCCNDTLPPGKVSAPTKRRNAGKHDDLGFTRFMICAQFIPVMFASRIQPASRQNSDLSLLLDELAKVSTRPRYAFMLLNLIADVAHPNGSAGPYVRSENALIPLRDWLSDALTPIGARETKREALAVRVQAEFEYNGRLPADAALALAMVEEEVRDRIRASGKTNLSRAVTELVKAGLLRRHYQGYRVDHLNRGAQRHAVYTLAGRARCLLGRQTAMPVRASRQGELTF